MQKPKPNPRSARTAKSCKSRRKDAFFDEAPYQGIPLFSEHFVTEGEAFRALWMEGEEYPSGQDLKNSFEEVYEGLHVRRTSTW